MKSKIQTALDNLNKAILEEMNEMSEKHRKTLTKLAILKKEKRSRMRKKLK